MFINLLPMFFIKDIKIVITTMLAVTTQTEMNCAHLAFNNSNRMPIVIQITLGQFTLEEFCSAKKSRYGITAPQASHSKRAGFYTKSDVCLGKSFPFTA